MVAGVRIPRMPCSKLKFLNPSLANLDLDWTWIGVQKFAVGTSIKGKTFMQGAYTGLERMFMFCFEREVKKAFL